ncbi:MAG: ATPase [Caulobacteraceae bacterium]|nr:ATPase [Caulobacteraceae bacterium]
MTVPRAHTSGVHKVCVLETPAAPQGGWTPCLIDTHIKVRPQVLRSYLFAPWQPVIYDLSLVAAAVNFCDWNCKRPSNIWERRFELRIPVHEPARWNDPPVRTALQRVLQTLTGDRWDLTFIDRQSPYPSPSDQSLALPSKTQAAIAFSDGLDSQRRELVRRRARRRDHRSRAVVGRGYKAQPRRVPFTPLPFKVKALPKIRHETSQRARGFKFAAASGLAASLANVSDIIVPESGSGALGPVLVRYGGMYSDFRNHPKFFRQMEAFLSALLGRQLNFKQPRLEMTKGESLLAYLDHTRVNRDAATVGPSRGALLLAETRHYVAVGDGTRRQCGVCASCMLRRLSMHVAGIEEASETYSWENLNAPDLVAAAPDKYKDKIGPAQRNYAIAGTLHLTHLAGFDRLTDYAGVTARHAREIADATGSDQATVKRWLDEFLQRHEVQWRDFLATLDAGSFVKQWAGSP